MGETPLKCFWLSRRIQEEFWRSCVKNLLHFEKQYPAFMTYLKISWSSWKFFVKFSGFCPRQSLGEEEGTMVLGDLVEEIKVSCRLAQFRSKATTWIWPCPLKLKDQPSWNWHSKSHQHLLPFILLIVLTFLLLPLLFWYYSLFFYIMYYSFIEYINITVPPIATN